MLHLYFAPLEGITTYPYRNLHHKYFGGVDKYFTPFLAPGPETACCDRHLVWMQTSGPSQNAGAWAAYYAALRTRCVLNRAKASPLLHQTKCRTQHTDQGTARKTACGRTRALPQRPRMRSKKDFFSGYIKYWYSSRCSLKYTG